MPVPALRDARMTRCNPVLLEDSHQPSIQNTHQRSKRCSEPSPREQQEGRALDCEEGKRDLLGSEANALGRKGLGRARPAEGSWREDDEASESS